MVGNIKLACLLSPEDEHSMNTTRTCPFHSTSCHEARFNMVNKILLSALLVGSARAAVIKSRAEFVPLPKFLNDTKQATYKDYSTTAVRDEAAFLEVQKFILSRYGGVTHPGGAKSFVISEKYYDCIPFHQQPTIHVLNLTKEEINEPVELPDGPPGPPPEEKDEFGNIKTCLGKTVPVTRFTLEGIFDKHATLKDFQTFGALQPPEGNSTGNVNIAKRQVDVWIDGRKHVHTWTQERDIAWGIVGGSAVFNLQ